MDYLASLESSSGDVVFSGGITPPGLSLACSLEFALFVHDDST